MEQEITLYGIELQNGSNFLVQTTIPTLEEFVSKVFSKKSVLLEVCDGVEWNKKSSILRFQNIFIRVDDITAIHCSVISE